MRKLTDLTVSLYCSIVSIVFHFDNEEDSMKSAIYKEKNDRFFPRGFLWGSAMASYQVSGCDNTQWAVWERSKKRSEDLAASGELEKHGLSNFICGSACEHDKRFREDFLLAKLLAQNALRFGAEPTYVMPKKDVFDEYYLSLYSDMVRYAKFLDVTPVFNLWHWTIPVWWAEEGGWASPRAPEYFAAYVSKLVETLKDNMPSYWVTLNETNVYINMSYLCGQWPPQMKDESVAFVVRENLIEGHNKAYEIIKRANPDAKVGIAENLTWHEMRKGTEAERSWKKEKDREWNWYFLDRISDSMEFVGMNHYGRNRYGGNDNRILSDLKWELYPEAIFRILRETHDRYHLPILITENGLADAEDTRRGWFIYETLEWVHEAIKGGVPVIGYLHWSLMDNFEWACGFWPRFGLIKIDRENRLRREVRSSALFYADVCRENAITKHTVSRYQHVLALPSENHT